MKYAAAFVLGAVIYAASAPAPRVSRTNLAAVEQKLDRGIVALDLHQPGGILGATRGVYLDGYGVVFSTEVELLPYAAPNPFKPEYSKPEIARLKGTKQLRIAVLRQRMREAMIAAGAALDSIPVNEQIAYAVTIPYWKWEDSSGMPSQILMQAPRSALLQGSRGNTLAVEAAMKVQEF